MSKKLGRSIIVLNKPGAATMVGTAEAAKAAPDGTTMLFAANTNLINNIALFDKLPYDPVNDFAPVVRLVALPLMIFRESEGAVQNASRWWNTQKSGQGDAGVGRCRKHH